METLACLAEARDKGVFADSTGAADDDDERVGVGRERVGAEGGA